MQHVATMVMWICLTAMVGGCMAAVYSLDVEKSQKQTAIAIECVKSGGDWVSSWGVPHQCVHEK